jgi:hypothetical protein
MTQRLLGLNRRNGIAIAAIVLILGLAYGPLSHWSTRYEAWLVAFSIWMIWFVVTVVLWLAEADF